MRNEIKITVRAYDVVLQRLGSGIQKRDAVFLSEQQIHLAELAGIGVDEFIRHACAQQGYNVLSIGSVYQKEAILSLSQLYTLAIEQEAARNV